MREEGLERNVGHQVTFVHHPPMGSAVELAVEAVRKAPVSYTRGAECVEPVDGQIALAHRGRKEDHERAPEAMTGHPDTLSFALAADCLTDLQGRTVI